MCTYSHNQTPAGGKVDNVVLSWTDIFIYTCANDVCLCLVMWSQFSAYSETYKSPILVSSSQCFQLVLLMWTFKKTFVFSLNDSKTKCFSDAPEELLQRVKGAVCFSKLKVKNNKRIQRFALIH